MASPTTTLSISTHAPSRRIPVSQGKKGRRYSQSPSTDRANSSQQPATNSKATKGQRPTKCITADKDSRLPSHHIVTHGCRPQEASQNHLKQTTHTHVNLYLEPFSEACLIGMTSLHHSMQGHSMNRSNHWDVNTSSNLKTNAC